MVRSKKKKSVGYELLNACKKSVILVEGDMVHNVEYLDCFNKVPAVGYDGKEYVVWFACKYLNLTLEKQENLINTVPWDPKGFHKMYSNVEEKIRGFHGESVVQHSSL